MTSNRPPSYRLSKRMQGLEQQYPVPSYSAKHNNQTPSQAKCSVALRKAANFSDNVQHALEQGMLNKELGQLFLKQAQEIESLLQEGECTTWTSQNTPEVQNTLTILPSQIEDVFNDSEYIADEYASGTQQQYLKHNPRNRTSASRRRRY